MQAILAVGASQSALVDLFERIENFFTRLGIYVQLPPTAEMTHIIVKVMVEVLFILAFVTKEIEQGKISKFVLDNMSFIFDLSFLERFMKKLVGRSDIEDALRRLDKLTHEEGQMVAAQGLSATHGMGERVTSLGDGINIAINAVHEGVHLLLVVDTVILFMARW